MVQTTRVGTSHSDSQLILSSSSRRVHALLARSGADMSALRLSAHDYGGRPLAAGMPWFMTLFGRDALIAAWFGMLLRPATAIDTLNALARFQGRVVDAQTGEQPGRIVHEVRLGRRWSGWLPRPVYYGSIDATLLFVMLLNQAELWGADRDSVTRLLPAADRCLMWMDEFGDPDGDGFLEYDSDPHHLLVNQGWKDSTDAIQFADGRQAVAPIALCEVQAYAYAALRARGALARYRGIQWCRDETEPL